MLLVFQAEGEAGAERGLAGDDAVAAPVVLVGGEEVHRSALALRAAAAGLPNSSAMHSFMLMPTARRVAVVAVGGDDVVVLAAQADGADGDGFLADVEVQEAAHLAALVLAATPFLFETADAHAWCAAGGSCRQR